MKIKEAFQDSDGSWTPEAEAILSSIPNNSNPQFRGDLVTGDWFMFDIEDAGQTFAAVATSGGR